MTVLGLNANRADSAACLFVDGKLVAAAEEERFRRIRHWAGLPTHAIDYCLREGQLKLGDVDHIAINRNPGLNKWRQLGFVFTHRPHPKLMWQRIKSVRGTAPLKQTLEEHYQLSIGAQIHHIEHHLAHLASAFFVSGFNEAACLSIDGFGDFGSAALGFGGGNKLNIDKRVYFPHSLGIFYSALTQFVGFPHYRDESKLMALAPFGEPIFLEQMRELVRVQPDGTFRLNLKYFRHHIDYVPESQQDGAPAVRTFYRDTLVDLLGAPRKSDEPLEQRHKDIARSVQTIYEKSLFELLHALHKLHPSDNLALAGGCAMNAAANGKVYRRTPFKKMYIPAAPTNAGGAIGAAAYVQSQVTNHQSPTSDLRPLTSAYFGPASSEAEIHTLLDWRKRKIADAGCTVAMVPDEQELLRRTAQSIVDGKIVGWFQERMEWGPCALGNRSILADPRRADIKDLFSAKIKPRESFRPFAMSILREAVSDWFEQDDDVPFMAQVFHIRPKHRTLIPAVTHVDGSSQLQTVHKETNPRFYGLISAFSELTSVPILLNTAFSENEPIVCYSEEALECFLRTRMDLLVLGNFCIERRG